ncbi:hypothetical protein A7U60_g1078 [Sanghuangporus baumii]|uniref:Reverse transcriptase domain-containing protein n=1 Tax=Sanghuangporus baumii TaxID=108892 RepID=A0A9Q5I5T4_SANBA|nr:hypothetical protein A7U60_g1078 [Sanghuangporus baumii]
MQPTTPLPGPSMMTVLTSSPPIATLSSFGKLQEPGPIIPSEEEEEEEEEEEHEMSLSKEAMTDLATAATLALQAAGEGVNQGSKASKKVHIAKPRDFNGKHDYVDFKRELHLYVYASKLEFRTNKNESKDDDNDFEIYEDLFVRRTDAQAGKLREEEWIQTAVKNEVVVEEPYRENVVAWVNITEAVWDVVGRCTAEVWCKGIEEAEQFIRRVGGKELDAFVSIVHPKVAGDNEVNLSNPGLEDEHFIDAHALIDSGCTGSCIDEGFVKRYGFLTRRYIRPRPVFNADGTSNKGGLIKGYVMVWMFFGKHEEEIRLAVTSLASSNIFLGYDWLQKHNPEINWKVGSVKFMHCPDKCDLMLSQEEIDNEYMRNVRMKEAAKWPPYLEEYADIFSEESFKRLLNHRMWDHTIDLKLDFKPSDCKVYPLLPKEQEAMKEFIKENLASGCIQQSKSPMASPFFFIKKEDGSLRAIQDYWKLNEGTVKNKYPLPLINELINKVKDAKYITKLDVCWGYYNIWIRKGDKWEGSV